MEKSNNNLNLRYNNRNTNLDIYKGILIIFVVIRHVLQYSVSDEGGIITNIIWAIQMPGFMFVAGFFSAKKINGIQIVGKRILNSALHYMIPFFSWYILIDILLTGKRERSVQSVLYIFNHIDSGLWFLWVVFFLSIISNCANYTISSEKKELLKPLER